MINILSWIAQGIVCLFYKSYRFTYINTDHLEEAKELGPNGSYLLSIWHQNLFAGILAQRKTPHVVIVSRSKDAEILTRVMVRMGHTPFRGSSRKGNVDKGGKEAKNDMIEVLSTGLPGAITVDGPKGPAHMVKPGIVDMASKSGIPIVPYHAKAQSQWVFNSWDKFRLPKPFSKIIVSYGSPIQIAKDLNENEFSRVQSELAHQMEDHEKAVSEAYF